MINRFEKVVLVIRAGLGAGLWGFGLLLTRGVPYEFGYPKIKWFLSVTEQVIGVSVFLCFQLVVIKSWIKGRRQAWLLFFTVVVSAEPFHYLFYLLSDRLR